MKQKIFSKLRNRFLILILSIFSVVMVISLAAVYFVVYNRVQVEYETIQGTETVVEGEMVLEQYTFTEIVGRDWVLTSLFTTLLVVGLIMLIVIFAVSYYSANRAIKPVADSWEKQKQFIADASHELKTPLTIIKSNYGMLLSNPEKTVESQIEWLEYMKEGMDRMEKLLSSLLDLAKMDGASMQIYREPFDISSSIETVIQSLEAAACEKGIQVVTEIEPEIIIDSDKERVNQVVAILLDNAIKYTNQNGRIAVSLQKTKQQITCTVENSGKGISQEEISRIFDRFYRRDSSRNSESGGYGLGLPIAKAIIEMLGGSIHATSVENESTIFWFTLADL